MEYNPYVTTTQRDYQDPNRRKDVRKEQVPAIHRSELVRLYWNQQAQNESTSQTHPNSISDSFSARSHRAREVPSLSRSMQHHSNDTYGQKHYKETNKREDEKLNAETEEQIKATIFGQCVGDAIGLLSEFMTREEAQRIYGRYAGKLELPYKVNDQHRRRWDTGDWTDDSDQMILIMQSLTDNEGEVSATDFARRLGYWSKHGFPELQDTGGQGIGNTTYEIMQNPVFGSNPEKAAKRTWENSGGHVAPNGGIMRTSILGIHQFWNLSQVIANAGKICKTTHYDPRCQASAIAVSVAIALMLDKKKPYFVHGNYDVNAITQTCYKHASQVLSTPSHRDELQQSLWCRRLESLKLDEKGKIGYTYKCLGAGFWALNQTDFEQAMCAIVMSGGDADTNGAVAGALLGCKLRRRSTIKTSWLCGLKHGNWLEIMINRYLVVLRRMSKSKAGR